MRNKIIHDHAPISDDEWILIWQEGFGFAVLLYFQESCENDAIRFFSGNLREIDTRIGHNWDSDRHVRARFAAGKIANFLRAVIGESAHSD